jgi:hypothetical protein
VRVQKAFMAVVLKKPHYYKKKIPHKNISLLSITTQTLYDEIHAQKSLKIKKH